MSAQALTEHLPDPALGRLGDAARPHRDPAQASARQGRGCDRSRGGRRFRAGRPAGSDRRGEHADAEPARPRALPRAGRGDAAGAGDPGAGCRQCACWRWRRARSVALQPLTGKGLPVAALDGGVGAETLKRTGDRRGGEFGRRTDTARTAPGAGVAKRPDRAAGDARVINPAAYAHERAVCVDTTAAGGNASLLAAA